MGGTLGEEILFDKSMQTRRECASAETEACLIGLVKQTLASLQVKLLKQVRKDYYVLESTLKGNYLMKEQWRAI